MEWKLLGVARELSIYGTVGVQLSHFPAEIGNLSTELFDLSHQAALCFRMAEIIPSTTKPPATVRMTVWACWMIGDPV